MINLLKKYYGLNLDFYKTYGMGGLFFVNGDYYYFFLSPLNEEEIVKINSFVDRYKSQVNFHNFVLNNNGHFVSEGYVLIKLNSLIENIELSEIEKFAINTNLEASDLFHVRWSERIDYLERQLEEMCLNKLISNSFDYFSGIAELLVLYLIENYNYGNDTYLAHRSIKSMSTIEYYNPVNVCIGNKYNDIAAYIFLHDDWNLLSNLLDIIDENDKIYLFVKLAFPFYYFGLVNMYVLGDEDKETEILMYIEHIADYEKYLDRLEKMFNYHVFDWIKKDN